MSKFIKLSRIDYDGQINININFIVLYEKNYTGSFIQLVDEQYIQVKETPEQIMKLINEVCDE